MLSCGELCHWCWVDDGCWVVVENWVGGDEMWISDVSVMRIRARLEERDVPSPTHCLLESDRRVRSNCPAQASPPRTIIPGSFQPPKTNHSDSDVPTKPLAPQSHHPTPSSNQLTSLLLQLPTSPILRLLRRHQCKPIPIMLPPVILPTLNNIVPSLTTSARMLRTRSVGDVLGAATPVFLL